MGEFRMPSLGADMDAGTVVEWLVHPGDTVARGDIVAVVATDKADIEVEVFENGVVEELLVPPGETVAIGTPLARLRTADGAAPASLPTVAEAPAAPSAPAAPTMPAAPTAPAAPTGATGAPSPVVRRLARHLGVNLAGVAGTGPGGAITRSDVEAAAGSPTAGPGPEPDIAPSPDRAAAMRDALADLMARSKREIPHYYLATDVDVSRARAWLDTTNAARAVTERLLPVVLVCKAVALAARAHPEMNGTWVDGAFTPATDVNVGIAVSLRGGGLIAPALANVDVKPLDQIAAELRDLVNRTRHGRLRAAEMSGPTITVTNLGEQGVDRVFGVVYPPQVALVGVGRITERPWARDGMLGVHPVVTISLSADHRVSDGHRGGRFLTAIDRALQEPEEL